MSILVRSVTALCAPLPREEESFCAEPAPPAAPPVPACRQPLYWFWIGCGHTQSIRAASEDDARRAILTLYPHARGQRLTIAAWED